MTPALKRLREPSTWAGLAALLVLIGVESNIARDIVNILAGISGLIAVFLPSPNGE